MEAAETKADFGGDVWALNESSYEIQSEVQLGIKSPNASTALIELRNCSKPVNAPSKFMGRESTLYDWNALTGNDLKVWMTTFCS